MENPEFTRFALHWGFRIRACRPYRAQTKGEVERPVRYLRESYRYGRTFLGDGDLAAQTAHREERVANARVHGTTQEVRRARFERDERAALQPLAARPYRPLVLSSCRSARRTPGSGMRPPRASWPRFLSCAPRRRRRLCRHVAATIPLGRVGLPDDVGAAVSVLLSDGGREINGARIEGSGDQNLRVRAGS